MQDCTGDRGLSFAGGSIGLVGLLACSCLWAVGRLRVREGWLEGLWPPPRESPPPACAAPPPCLCAAVRDAPPLPDAMGAPVCAFPFSSCLDPAPHAPVVDRPPAIVRDAGCRRGRIGCRGWRNRRRGRRPWWRRSDRRRWRRCGCRRGRCCGVDGHEGDEVRAADVRAQTDGLWPGMGRRPLVEGEGSDCEDAGAGEAGAGCTLPRAASPLAVELWVPPSMAAM